MSESRQDMNLSPMQNRDWRRVARSFLMLINLTVLVSSCKTIEPLYVPPEGIFFNPALSAAAFSPSGLLAAVANFNTIWIFDTTSGELRSYFTRHDRFGTNNTLVFMDENRIASTAKSKILGSEGFHAAVKIWDLTNPYRVPIVIEIPELDPYAIALGYSRTTGALAVGDENGAVALLESDGRYSYTRKSLPGLNGPVLSLTFNQDGTLLAAGGVDTVIPIWDLQSLSEVGSLPAEDTVYDLDLVPGRQALLVTSSDLRLWEFITGDVPEKIKNPSLAGDYISVGAIWATYAVVTAATVAFGGQASAPPWPVTYRLEPDYGFCKREADVSPDGNYIVHAHAGLLKEKIRVLDLTENTVVKWLNPSGGKTCGVAFSPDGSKLLIANDRVARLYDTNNWDFEDFALE